MRPDARRDRLLIEEVGDELVVYDLQRHRVHQLNRAAALVWQSCAGDKTVAELTNFLHDELNTGADELIVYHALDRLGKAGLLREPVPRPVGAARMTRRQALRRLGRTAAVALLVPAVTSITAPAPLQAGHDDCDKSPCSGLCKDQCKTDPNCPRSTPLCRLLACNSLQCPKCTQRRCTKNVTAHHIGGGGD